MFLILLGDVGWVPLPSENFRGFFIGPADPTADETETVLTWRKKAIAEILQHSCTLRIVHIIPCVSLRICLNFTLHSATFRGPKIVARSFTLTSSSMSSVSTVLILLSVMLMISAEFTLKTWFFRLFFNSGWSRTSVRVWKGLEVANESSDGLCCRWGELFVGMRLVRDPIDHFFSEMLFFSLNVELKLSGKDLREMKVGSGCLRSTSFRETLIVAEEMVSGSGWEVSTLKVGGGEGGGVSSFATLGGEEGEGGVSVSVS